MEEKFSLFRLSMARDELYLRLIDCASRRFQNLQLLTRTDTCRIYFFEFDSQRYVIKDFLEKERFEVELSAFIGLAQTNRVCELVFDATRLPDFWSDHFNGPYFLVKPHFDRIHQREGNGFRLIDQAAQEVVISRELFGRGWRDLDGEFNNDAVAQDGRVIRFDLDSAQPNWARIRKFRHIYQSVKTRDNRNRILELYDELFSEETELVSMAMRVSRWLLDITAPDWSLLDRIQTPVRQIASSTKPSRLRNFTVWLGWNADTPTDDSESPNDLLLLKRDWLDHWQRMWPSTTLTADGLSKGEARLLGHLLFHVISQREPQFSSLGDLYFSLLLLLVMILERRESVLPLANHQALLQQMVELKLYLPESDVDIAGTTAVEAAQARAVSNADLTWSKDSGSWKATQKALGWRLEDFVLETGSDIHPVLVVADGASGANGELAVGLVKSICESWSDQLDRGSADKTQQVFSDLAAEINRRLVEEGFANNTSWETTLVLASLCLEETPPSLVVGRWGNSSFFLTFQKPSGLPYKIVSFRDRSTPSLGGWNRASTWEQIPKIVTLNNEGIYRLRIFTDGVKESIQAELLGSKTIKELIKEAGDWPKRDERIGVDDWALAGFDVDLSGSAQEKTFVPAATEVRRRDAQLPVSIKIADVAVERFEFSKPARTFWRRMIASDSRFHEFASSSVINRAFGSIPIEKSVEKAESPSSIEVAPASGVGKLTPTSISPSSPTRFRRMWQWWQRIAFEWKVLFFLVIGGALIFGYFWLNSASFDLRRPVTAPEESAQRQSAESQLVTDQQKRIFNSLQAVGGSYDLWGVPKGSSVNDRIFSELLKDVAAVLRQTNWSIDVEVHTDRTGPADRAKRQRANMLTSQQRAQLLTSLFANQAPELVARVRFVGKGDSQSRVQVEVSEQDQAFNRRIVVRRAS